jgi:5-formyltetrahydrofolate cyclo-ligase
LNLAEEKQALRKEMRAIRRDFHKASGERASFDLMELVSSSAALKNAEIISCFWPIQTEVNTVPLIHKLYKAGHQICLPIVVGNAQPLIFRQWTPETEMLEGAYKAMTPVESSPQLVPDLILSPLLAFDRNGYRLGYGGGFYDRSIEEIKTTKPLVTAGLAYSVQEVDNVPTEKTDQKLDFLITEKEILEFT